MCIHIYKLVDMNILKSIKTKIHNVPVPRVRTRKRRDFEYVGYKASE